MQTKPVLSEFKALIRLSIPAVLTQLAHMLYVVIDTVMAGQISPVALASLATGVNVFVPLAMLGIGILVALNPLIAHAHGKRAHKHIAELVWSGFMVCFLVAIPLITAMHWLEPLLHIFDIKPELIPITTGYLKAVSWSLLPSLMFYNLRSLHEGLLKTHVILWVSLLGIPFNILFNYLLMFGHAGFPKLGTVGAGYATTLVCILLWLGMHGYSWFNLNMRPYLRYKRSYIQSACIRKILTIGLPIGMSIAIEGTLFSAIGILIAQIGVLEVGAHQIALNIASTFYMLPLGLSFAISARVGYAYGKQKAQGVPHAVWTGMACSAFFSSCNAGIIVLFSEELVRFYSADEQLVSLAMGLMSIAALFQIMDGLQCAAMGALRGLQDTKIPMFIALGTYWLIGYPTAFILGRHFDLSLPGYWYGLCAGLLAASIANSYRLYRQVQRI